MSIHVRYFASLREQMDRESDEIDSNDIKDVSDVWQQVTEDKDMPGNILCAINKEYVQIDTSVKDGDEVAFFPPVTGG